MKSFRFLLKPISFLLLSLFSFLPKSVADTPPSDAIVVKLWNSAPPGSMADPAYKERETDQAGNPANAVVQQITDPRMEVYLPAKNRASGAAVVICPGGGYGGLVYNHEGRNFARWFQERGVAGIVLYYRLPSDLIMKDKSVGPLQDAQRAIRVVRKMAPQWGLARDKIGVMGFSAGGHVAGSVSTLYNEVVYPAVDETSARPDFSLLIYGVLSFQDAIVHQGSRKNLLGTELTEAQRDRFSTELHVSASTPPTFLVHATDDTVVNAENSVRYYEALQKNHVPAELHLYDFGGHGFGMRNSGPDWLPVMERWLRRHQWITQPAPS